MSADMSVQEMMALFGYDGYLEHVERKHPPDYGTFLKHVQSAVNAAVASLERNAKHYFLLKEDQLSVIFVEHLIAQELNAAHDADYSGHLDVSIESQCKKYVWGAEAKIDYSLEWLQQGVGQLLGSYLDGTTNRDKAGLLIYIKNEDASGRMTAWRSQCKTNASGDLAYSDRDCPDRKDFAFFNSQTLRRTGRPVEIRHIGVSLWRQRSIELEIEREEKALADQLIADLKAKEKAIKAATLKPKVKKTRTKKAVNS
jgi:hypothetical protein